MNLVCRRFFSVAGAWLTPVLAAACVLVNAPANSQTDFPNRRIHLVLPYPTGGIADVATRIVTDKLSEMWRQPIVIEAKPAAHGNLAWDEVSRARPDGDTWTFITSATMVNPRIDPNLRWSEKSFVPIGATVWGPGVVVVHPSVPVNTVAEFIDYVRKHPGVLRMGYFGVGSGPALSAAVFLNATKLDVVAVPYNGAPPSILDLMANRVQFAVLPLGLVVQHIDSGAMKALAVVATTRAPFLPNTPRPMSCLGRATASTRGTPQPVVDKIVAGFNEVMKNPNVREALQKQALQPIDPMNAGDLAELYATDTEKYAKIIREANIKLSD